MQPRKAQGFTLIEMLVTISILGILAALVYSSMSQSDNKTKVAVANAQLTQVESAINEYHTDLGFFPPDNPNDPAMNPLYFELQGTTNDGKTYVTLDGSAQISVTNGDLNATFNLQGFANSGKQARSSDEKGAPMRFLTGLRPDQVGGPDAAKPLIKILVCSVEWPVNKSPAPIPNTVLNPWHYVSSHPTNNAGSFDLWVDLAFGNKTYRVSNWSKQAEIVP
jgi:prepilin-type N-terminal cleavage/methylation domain-containing protein